MRHRVARLAAPEPNFGDAARPLARRGRRASPPRDERNDDELPRESRPPSLRFATTWARSWRDAALVSRIALWWAAERGPATTTATSAKPEELPKCAVRAGVDLRDAERPEAPADFDPPGIGRSASECLALQLANQAESKTRDLALRIVRKHLDQLAARDYVRLRKAVACSEDELREAQTLIRSLNPRPGAQYSPSETRYVVPDVVVRKVRGQWTASLNGEAMPKLRINRLYADILQGQRGSGLASQLQEAKWLIKNVQQRFETIQRVSQAIVDRQRQFFEHGEVAMRPLTLREIADQLGLHESTISRVTTQKYMATPRGVYELKYFFGSHVATEAGGAASSTAIRALIKQLVGAEDGKKPLSDAQLAEILGQQGIVVARRTVAKYREALNIPPVNLRKSI